MYKTVVVSIVSITIAVTISLINLGLCKESDQKLKPILINYNVESSTPNDPRCWETIGFPEVSITKAFTLELNPSPSVCHSVPSHLATPLLGRHLFNVDFL